MRWDLIFLQKYVSLNQNKDFTRLYDLIVAIDRSRKLYGDRKSAEAESPQRVRVEDGVEAKSVGEYFK